MPLTLSQTIQNDAMAVGAIARDAGERIVLRERDALLAGGTSPAEADMRASVALSTPQGRATAIESFRTESPEAFLSAEALREAQRRGVVGVMKAVTRAQLKASEAQQLTQRMGRIQQRAHR